MPGPTFRLELLTPARRYAGRDVEALDVPAAGGRLTVLARHEPFVCAIAAGPMTVRPPGGAVERWTVAPGAMMVKPGAVTLLLREAAPAE